LIAGLIALLLPALSRAREQARTAACASNIRQISVAALAYASRNDSYLPIPVNAISFTGGLPETAIWGTAQLGILDFSQGTLIPDLGGPYLAEELFKCPDDEEPRMVSAYFTTRARNFSFVFNAQVVDGYRAGRWKSKRITMIRSPSTKGLLFENADSLGINVSPVGYDPAAYAGPRLYIAVRHHNRSNVFFADGHVDLFDSLLLKDESVTSVADNWAWVKYFRFDSE